MLVVRVKSERCEELPDWLVEQIAFDGEDSRVWRA